MTFQSKSRSASITGRSAAAQTSIQNSAILASKGISPADPVEQPLCRSSRPGSVPPEVGLLRQWNNDEHHSKLALSGDKCGESASLVEGPWTAPRSKKYPSFSRRNSPQDF